MSTPQTLHRVSPADELARRMRGPQRHRLLHGYPLAGAMPPASAPDFAPEHAVAFNRAGRKLLVGVLPHPFCNPAVSGCGFCTFPHQPGNSAKTAGVVEDVIREINQAVERQLMDLLMRPVHALYFGGGTANLTETAAFSNLCKCLRDAFDLTHTEVTLEGVPAYFLRKPLLLDIMRKRLGARHYRLSMGVQTFDEARLKEMGRTAFGTPDTFREVVELGHSLGFTASADLLFNLPGQTLDQMKDDLRKALDLGLDHVGLYHLVLFRGLGTAWADDAEMIDGLPENEQAAGNWQALRELLLARGFVQTSLTNFEQARYQHRDERFQYEESVFRSDEFEIAGFGPSAISYSATGDFAHGIKTMNPTGAAEYGAAVQGGTRVWDKAFVYRPLDQKVFWLTRRLAALDIDRARYRELFGADPLDDFPEEIGATRDAGLLSVTGHAIRPTPRGMFYADAVAAVLASPAIREYRERGPAMVGRHAPAELLHDTRENANAHFHM